MCQNTKIPLILSHSELSASETWSKYTHLDSIANKNYGGAFFVSRTNKNKLKLFYHEGDSYKEHGIFTFFEEYGLGYTNGEGFSSTSNARFKFNSDSFIIICNQGVINWKFNH